MPSNRLQLASRVKPRHGTIHNKKVSSSPKIGHIGDVPPSWKIAQAWSAHDGGDAAATPTPLSHLCSMPCVFAFLHIAFQQEGAEIGEGRDVVRMSDIGEGEFDAGLDVRIFV